MRKNEIVALAAFFFCVLFFFHPGFGEVTAPADPSVPDVTVTQGGKVFIKSEISLSGGDELSGTIVSSSDSVSFSSIAEATLAPHIEKVADISEISFLEWQGEKRQGGAWFFTPSLVKITMRNGNAYRCSSLAAFNRFTFFTEGKNSWKYSCFYGYQKNGVWENGLDVSQKGKTSKPVTGTVVKIAFKTQDENDPVRSLFRYLQR